MSYTINEQLSDSDWTAAINALATFGTPRRIESITIHHWGSFGQTHYGVVDFFVNRNANTSAHFVASDNLIHCLVSPENVAWAAGNAYGNATSIHIEARPEATDGDYRTVSWLVAWLRSVYGHNLPLRAHSSWSATACPGKWDLARVDREARAWTAKEFTEPSTSVTPQSTKEYIMSWDTKIQEYGKDGKTKAGVKTAAFIMGNLNQWVVRILEGQEQIRRDIAALRKDLGK